MNVAETILSRGESSVSAVISRDGGITFGELRERVAVVATVLLARGHRKGDRIGIFSENSSFFVATYLGVIRAGMAAVPFQTELSLETFEKIVADAGITAVFVSKRFSGRLRSWADSSGVALLPESELEERNGVGGLDIPPGRARTSGKTVDEQRESHSGTSVPEVDSVEDLAALMFTSGSTGSPKGVMVSHRNIECNTRDIVSYLGLTPEDRVMVVLPFHYCFGLSLLHSHLMAGGSVVLNNDFKLYPETVLQEMQQRECTGFAGVPSTYQILLRKSRFRRTTFPKLRWFQQAGGKLPNPCIAEILEGFPQVRYFLMYGQTEGTARLSYLPPERMADKLGSIGKGLPSTQLEVLRPDGTPVLPGSNETGEIVARGDNVALGYWNDPEETAKYFRHGRLHTGDIARVDSEGFIFIVEREKEMVKSGGNRVSAKEVEDIIAELAEVVETAVVGVAHELLGEAIKAFVVVVPNAGITPKDVEAHCRRRLPPFKVPGEVVFLKAMPHNSSGKIMKAKLKEIDANGFREGDGPIGERGQTGIHGVDLVK